MKIARVRLSFLSLTPALVAVACAHAPAAPAPGIANLSPALPANTVALHFHEVSGQVTDHTWPADTPRLFEKMQPPLGSYDCDFVGEGDECYDVFFSDEKGALDPRGRYLTIEASFLESDAKEGGLNLAEIVAELSTGEMVSATKVIRAVGSGANAQPASFVLAVDGNLETWSVLGTSANGIPLSLTVGF